MGSTKVPAKKSVGTTAISHLPTTAAALSLAFLLYSVLLSNWYNFIPYDIWLSKALRPRGGCPQIEKDCIMNV